MLKLAKNLELPEAAITSRICPLGMTGSGKTYTARRLLEQLLKAKGFTVVVDPKGDWFGVRAGRNGDPRQGYGVLIMGGDHADVPLQPTAGKVVAEFLNAERVSTILDISEWSESDMVRFVGDFGSRFYTLNRGRVHLVIDEADEFAPQAGQGMQVKGPVAAALGACQRLQRRGRGRGIGTTFISQRSAVLSKGIITQASILIAHRTKHPRDIAPIKDWLLAAYGPKLADAAVEQLPHLADGEAIVGGAPDTSEPIRVQILAIETFDSMRTPDSDDRREPKGLADVNVAKLTARIAESIEQAKANDPAELRKRIAELERQVKSKPAAASSGATSATVTQGQLDRYAASRMAEREKEWREKEKLWSQRFDAVSGQYNALAKRIEKAKAALGVDDVLDRHGIERPEVMGKLSQRGAESSPVSMPKPTRSSPAATGDSSLGKPLQKILDSLAWWESIGVSHPSTGQVGFVAGYSASGGTFGTYLSRLSTLGLVERSPGSVFLTDAGRAAATAPDASPSLADYHVELMRVVKQEPLQRILQSLIEAGQPISSDELGRSSGYEASGGTFGTYLSRLSTLGLIERNRGIIHPTGLLFPEGLA